MKISEVTMNQKNRFGWVKLPSVDHYDASSVNHTNEQLGRSKKAIIEKYGDIEVIADRFGELKLVSEQYDQDYQRYCDAKGGWVKSNTAE